MPIWSDKVVQDIIRSLLEAYDEPQFSPHSHGFRPHRGCHTALNEVGETWTGTKWFIEGDIKGCFSNIDHTILMQLLRANIHDNRFLRLIEGALKAGYCEEWTYHLSLSGSPQGGRGKSYTIKYLHGSVRQVYSGHAHSRVYARKTA
jgi:retron-type reverse transcriptase